MAKRYLAGVAHQQHHAHSHDAVNENESGLAQDVAIGSQGQQQQAGKKSQVLPQRETIGKQPQIIPVRGSFGEIHGEAGLYATFGLNAEQALGAHHEHQQKQDVSSHIVDALRQVENGHRFDDTDDDPADDRSRNTPETTQHSRWKSLQPDIAHVDLYKGNRRQHDASHTSRGRAKRQIRECTFCTGIPT